MLKLKKSIIFLVLFTCAIIQAKSQDTLSGNYPTLKIASGLHVIKDVVTVKGEMLVEPGARVEFLDPGVLVCEGAVIIKGVNKNIEFFGKSKLEGAGIIIKSVDSSNIDIQNAIFRNLQLPLFFDFAWKRNSVNISENNSHVSKQIVNLVKNDNLFILRDLNGNNITLPKNYDNILEIYHLDGISKSEKLLLEIKFQLSEGILTSKRKADLLILTANGIEIITYKDSSVAAKLGQVSSLINYANISIRGGLFGNIPLVNIPVVSHLQTGLSHDQFIKLQQRDKDLAFFKQNFPHDWDLFVRASMQESIDQLKILGRALTINKEVFLEFISKTLFGQNEIPSCFKIIFGDVMISSEMVAKFFKTGVYKIIKL